MDEDTEVVDWGNEDEEIQHPFEGHRAHGGSGESCRPDEEDDEDAVSLGPDEDDMQVFYAYQSRSRPDVSMAVDSTKPPHSDQSRDLQREHSGNSSKSLPQHLQSPRSSPQVSAKLTHALPPKPVVVSGTFPLPQSQLLEASAMAQSLGRLDRERRQSNNGKPISSGEDPLPPDWEVRQPRSGGREIYYYNVKTHESTWTRPILDIGKGTPSDRGHKEFEARSPDRVPRDRSPVLERPELRPIRSEKSSDNMSFEDRHYRPGLDLQPMPSANKREEHSLPKKPAYIDVPRPLTPSHTQYRTEQDEPPLTRHSGNSRARKGSPPHGRRARSASSRRRNSTRDIDSGGLAPAVYYRPSPDRSRHQTSTNDEDQKIFHIAERSSTSRPPRSPPPPIRDLLPVYTPRHEVDSYIPPTFAGASRKSRNRRHSASPEPSRSIRDPDGSDQLVSIPRRRGRDLEPDLMQVDENEAKRRRVDNRSDLNRKRPPPVHVPSADPIPIDGVGSPISSMQVGSTRRKRAPLPPQSIHFRDFKMTTTPTGKEVPSPSEAPLGSTHSPHAMAGFRDVVSKENSRSAQGTHDASKPGLRHQPPRTSRVSTFEQAPPSAPSGRRSRFNDARVAPPPQIFRQPDPMEIDPQPRTGRAVEVPPRPQGGMYADREEVVKDVLPKGPRAMSSKTHSYPSTSPTASPPTSLPPQRLPASRFAQSSPPSHINSEDRSIPRAPAEWSISGKPTPKQELSHDNPPLEVSRDKMKTGLDAERWSKRTYDRPPAGPQPKLSDTNSVPINGGKSFPPTGSGSLLTEPATQPLHPSRNGSLSGSNSQPIGHRPSRSGKESFGAIQPWLESTGYNQRPVPSQPAANIASRRPDASFPARTAPLPPSVDLQARVPPGHPRADGHRGISDASGNPARFGPPAGNSVPIMNAASSTTRDVQERSSLLSTRGRTNTSDNAYRLPSRPRSREPSSNPSPWNVHEGRGHNSFTGNYDENQEYDSHRHGWSHSIDRVQPERLDGFEEPHTGRGLGLEGRLTSQYQRRYDGDLSSRRGFVPSSPPRHRERDLDERDSCRDDRAFHGTHDGRAGRWDRSNSELPFPPPSPSFDSDSARFVESHPLDFNTSSHERTVLNRRSFGDEVDLTIISKDTSCPRSPVINGVDHNAYASNPRHGNGRPSNNRRGGSLLDRLSNDSPRGGEILAEIPMRRGDAPPKSSGERMENGDHSMVVDPDHDDRDRGQDVGSKAAKNRRKGGKPRRVRKNGQ